MAGESIDGIQMRQNIDTHSVYVCHMDNSSQYLPHEYGFSSWIDYWADKRGVDKPIVYTCPCCGKNSDRIEGGHVITKNTKQLFVTPVCPECNKKAENDESFRNTPFLVKRNELVPFTPK